MVGCVDGEPLQVARRPYTARWPSLTRFLTHRLPRPSSERLGDMAALGTHCRLHQPVSSSSSPRQSVRQHLPSTARARLGPQLCTYNPLCHQSPMPLLRAQDQAVNRQATGGQLGVAAFIPAPRYREDSQAFQQATRAQPRYTANSTCVRIRLNDSRRPRN